jgi:hypothetical protein
MDTGVAANNSSLMPRLILLAGVIEALVGVIHFPMALFLFRSPGFMALSSGEADFMRLILFALGLTLVSLGSLTVAGSLHYGKWPGLLLALLAIQSLLWCGRIGLEVLYPVAVPLFYIDRPTTLVMPLLIFEASLFILPLGVACWRRSAQSTHM